MAWPLERAVAAVANPVEKTAPGTPPARISLDNRDREHAELDCLLGRRPESRRMSGEEELCASPHPSDGEAGEG